LEGLANRNDGQKTVRHWCSTITAFPETYGEKRLAEKGTTTYFRLDFNPRLPIGVFKFVEG
jgi:L-lactate dehydrogenase complex protein LldG